VQLPRRPLVYVDGVERFTIIADVTERAVADRSTTWQTTPALSEPEAMSLLTELGFGGEYARALIANALQARGGTSMSA
jgi:hypothetical protein